MKTLPALKAALLLALGIIIGDHLGPIGFPRLWIATAAVLVIAFSLIRSSWSDSLVVLTLFFVGISGGNHGAETLRSASALPSSKAIWGGKIGPSLYRTDQRDVYRFDPDWRSSNGIDLQPFSGELRLICAGNASAISSGSRVVLYGRAVSYPEKRNPGARDLRREFARRGIVGWIKPDRIIPTSEAESSFNPRESVRNAITGSLPPPEASLLTGMILGEKSALPQDVKDDFQRSGLYHLLAVSGLHVGYLFIILLLIVRPLVSNLHLRRFILLLGLWGYVFITGAHPPTLRAALMITLVFLSYTVQRVPRIWNLWGAAAFLILLFDPHELFTPGFQLSFAAMAGIILSLEFWKKRDLHLPVIPETSHRRQQIIKNLILFPLLTGICVTALTAPILSFHFGGFALIAIILNLAAIPLAGAIFGLTWIMLFLKILLGVSPAALTGAIELLIKGLLVLAHSGAVLPGNTTGDFGGVYAALILAATVAGMIAISPWNRRILIGMAGLTLLVVVPLWTSSSYLRIECLDVGQGDAILLRFPHGADLLVDCGNEDAAEYELAPAFYRRGIKRIGNLLITHFDADHAAGALTLLDRFKVDRLLVSTIHTTDPLGNSILTTAAQKNIPVKTLVLGDTIAVCPAVTCLVLWPPEAGSGAENRQSIVMKVTYGETSLLLTGDVGAQEEEILSAGGDALRTDILKVAHHGSKYSSSPAFLRLVQPEAALISCGRNNPYHHPAQRVLSDLEKQGVAIYRTDQDHAEVFASNGKEFWQVDWK